MDLSTPKTKVVRFGLFEADLDRRVLTKTGLRVRLQDQPFQVLALLLERPLEIVSREEIQQKLWPADTYVAFDDGLNTAIKKLRTALGDTADNPRFIETIPRRGYRFLAAPTFAEIPAAEISASDPNLSVPGNSDGPANEIDGSVSDDASTRFPFPARPRSWAILLGLVALILAAVAVWQKASLASKSVGSVAPTANSKISDPTRNSIDPRAREEYIQARNYWTERTAEALTKAIDHFNLAIERDRNYAEAYAGLANCYVVLPMLSRVPSADTYLKARQASQKALALDDNLAEAHLAAAEIKLYADWNFSGAEKEFQRALELDAGDAQAHQWYAEFLSLVGRHAQAIEQIQIAQHLEPSSMIIHHQAGQIFQAARMYPQALQEYQTALMIRPGFGPTYFAMSRLYCRQGRFTDCIEAQRQANLYWDPGGTAIKDLQRLADAYASGGKTAFLRASLDFKTKHDWPDYYSALEYAQLGENSQALAWLQRSLDTRRPEIFNLQNDPEFDRLRLDPRFQEIVKKIGLPVLSAATKPPA